MSDPKFKAPKLATLTGMYVPWRMGTPARNESVRWDCVDGRWVAISMGHGDEAGYPVVSSSDGQRERCTTYDDALVLAKRWRTVL